jgi:hypothetical protein
MSNCHKLSHSLPPLPLALDGEDDTDDVPALTGDAFLEDGPASLWSVFDGEGSGLDGEASEALKGGLMGYTE